MPTFGQAPSWAYFDFVDSLGGSNQVASGKLTFPDNGWVTSVSVFVDNDSGSQTLNACVWDGNGNLIQSGGFTPGAGSHSAGGQHWHAVSLGGFFLAKNAGCYFGWTKANSGGTELWSIGGGNQGGVASGGNPGNLGSIGGWPFGSGQCGAYVTYTTVYAPIVTTDAASSIGTTTATLNGHVDNQGLQTSYYFQYGTTTSYGSSTASANYGNNGQFNGSSAVSANLTGLATNTTYHYRIVASNSVGTVYGADQQFTTSGNPNAPTLTAPANNAFESDWQNGTTFGWTYNPVSGSGQTAYFLKVTPAGGSAVWWNGSGWSTTETSVASSSGSVALTAGNMVAAGVTSSVQSYTWTVKTTDNIGTGPYASAFTVNNEIPPSAPTLTSPNNGSYADLAGTPTFGWTYNPVNGDSGQQAYAFRRKVSGGSSYSYWNAGSSGWQSTIVWNSSSVQSVTFPAAAWTDGNIYNWSVATQDDGGQGPFASDWTVTAEAAPTVNVTAPTGTETSFNPVVVWSATFPGGAAETAYQVRTFTQAQWTAPGFNPATSTATDDSGVIASTSGLSYQVATTLLPGQYRSYVNVTETGGVANGFNAFTQYTAAADTPNAPTLTATPTTDPATGCPMIQLQAQCEVNILSAVDSSFESGVGTWANFSNATLAQSNAQAQDGSFSLSMTANSAAQMAADSGEYAVTPNQQYTQVASFRAAATARAVFVQISWYDNTHTHISDSTGSTVNDTTSGWTQATVTGTAPANAAFARVFAIVNSPALNEVHYVDEVGLFPGTNTAWSLGGFLTTAGVVILRSDGVYVRLASTGTPAPLLPTGGSGNPNATVGQLVTVNDYEATQLTPYTYTAQIQGVNAITGGSVISSASAPAAATLAPVLPQWWELDPTNPAGAINAQPIAFNPQQYEQGAAHEVLGQGTPNYVSYVMQQKDMTATMELFSAAVYKGFLALTTSQKTIFFSSPFGESYYFRIAPAPGGTGGGGSKAHDTQWLPSGYAAPHLQIAITGRAQPRPPV